MNPTLWQRLQEIVDTASSLPAQDRSAYLHEVCGGDEDLRGQAEGMLAVYTTSDGIFEGVVGRAASRVAHGSDLDAGDEIGAYTILSVIGHGGMGTVYQAKRSDKQFRQDVAVKLVRSGPGSNQELFARFRAERQILANINHPNIARLLDGGVTDAGLPYLVMEFVEGLTLDVYITERKPPVTDRLKLFCQVCAAIQYAHQNLVVHRDLKPGNIMVTADGSPKLLDFGIAKLLDGGDSLDTVIYTRPAERLMTPEYASPEQIRGDAITTATDIYGLGVLLYELLTGTRPFRIGNLGPVEVERLICETQPRPPSSIGEQAEGATTKWPKRTDLDRIVLKALHKVPARRYPSAADFAADIQRYLEGFPVTARPDSVGYRSRLFIARHAVAVAAAALFVTVVIAMSVVLAFQANRARQEAESADAVSQFLVGLFNFTRPDATQGRSVSAREILDQGTKNLNAEWNGKPLIKARLLNTLGSVYYQLGDLDQARSLLTQAETIYGHESKTDSTELGETANVLGIVWLDKGDYQQSNEQFGKALAIFTAKKGRNSPEVADVLNGLGTLQWTQGNFEAAEKYQHQAIAIDTKLLGPDAAATLLDKGNLEAILADRGDYRAAEPLIREVLAGRRRLFGEDNTNTASSLNNLSFILDKLGRFQEAEPSLQHTLDLRRRLYGTEHPEIAMSLASLGWIKRELGELDQAKSLTEEALAMATKLEGPQSLDTAFDEDALGLVYFDSGDLAKARIYIAKALQTRLAKAHPSVPALSQSYDHLGLIDLAEGRLPEALQQIKRALLMRQRFYKAENDWVAISFNHLGRALLASGDPAAALDAYRSALRISRQNFGDSPHPIAVEALYGLAKLSARQGNVSEANSALQESLTMERTLYPKGNSESVRIAQARREATGPVRPPSGRSE